MKNIIVAAMLGLLSITSYAQTEKMVFTFKPAKSEKKNYIKMVKKLKMVDSFKNRYSFFIEKGDSISKIQIRSNNGFPLATIWPNTVIDASSFFTPIEISRWGILAGVILHDAKNSSGYDKMLHEYQKIVKNRE